jgi:hypothetical protein
MRPEIDRDITRVFESNNQPRIGRRNVSCIRRLDPESSVRRIGVWKRSRDLRHAAGT